MNFKINLLLKSTALFGCLFATIAAYAEDTLSRKRKYEFPTLDTLMQAKRPISTPIEEAPKKQGPAFIVTEQADYATPEGGAPRAKVKEWGEEFEPVKQVYGQAMADRANLAEMRAKQIARFQAEEVKKNPDYLSLTPAITDATIAYVYNLIDETIKKMGPPPTEFSLFTMGSMARDESGFFTDLEIGILVDRKDAEVKKYFDKFAQLLSDRLYLLGEHPAVQGKGLRIDEADNAPLHMKWFARYAAPTQMQKILNEANRVRNKDLKPAEGSRIFLATPEEFAGYLDPNILKKIDEQQKSFFETMRVRTREAWEQELLKPESMRRPREEVIQEVREVYNGLLRPLFGREKEVLASLLGLTRNLRHLYGNTATFDRFIHESKQYLDGPPSINNPLYENRRQEIVIKEFTSDIGKFLGDPTALVHGKLGDEIDLKRRLYRWPEQVLTNLGYWYDLDTQNGQKIIQELISRGLFNPRLGMQTRELLNFATGLRLREQAILRKQGKTIPLSQEEWAKGKAKLEDELAFQKNYEKFVVTMLPPLKVIEEDGSQAKIRAENAALTLAARDAAHAKVLELQVDLANFDKLKPFETGSIIQEKDIELLKTAYLPILNELFRRAQAFIEGDRNAFIDSSEEFNKKHSRAAEFLVAKPTPEPIIEPIAEKPVTQESPAPIIPKPTEIEQAPTQEPSAPVTGLNTPATLSATELSEYRIKADRGFVNRLMENNDLWEKIKAAAAAGNNDAKAILRNAAGVR